MKQNFNVANLGQILSKEQLKAIKGGETYQEETSFYEGGGQCKTSACRLWVCPEGGGDCVPWDGWCVLVGGGSLCSGSCRCWTGHGCYAPIGMSHCTVGY